MPAKMETGCGWVKMEGGCGTVTVMTVPVSWVIAGVLVVSNETEKRPPETVLSKLSVVSFAGLVFPLLRTGAQAEPLK